jgi:hypothetical protein
VWAVKKSRPAFQWRNREASRSVISEFTSPSFREVAATLHMTVFHLMSAEQGIQEKAAREIGTGVDSKALAAASKAAALRARVEAGAGAGEITEIVDPSSGASVVWHPSSRTATFSARAV